MRLFREFKKFALRGNVVDLAVGFTVGAAFTTLVKSLVNDVIMPPIGLFLGRVDFQNLFTVLKEGSKQPPPYATVAEAQSAGAVTLNWGAFANNAVALLVVALAVFVLVRLVNRLDEELEERFGRRKPKPEEPTEKKCPFCLSTIPYKATRCAQCTSRLEETA